MASTNYGVIEEAIRVHLRDKFALNDALAVVGEIDRLFENMEQVHASLGLLVDYENGQRMKQGPLSGKVWQWFISGVILLRYEGDSTAIEQQARTIINTLENLFTCDPHLGGVTAGVWVDAIKKPDPGKINEVPFYWIEFLMEAWEKI